MCWLLMTADCSEDQQRQEMCLDEAPLCQAGPPPISEARSVPTLTSIVYIRYQGHGWNTTFGKYMIWRIFINPQA